MTTNEIAVALTPLWAATYVLIGLGICKFFGSIKRSVASDWVGLIGILWPITAAGFMLGIAYLIISRPFAWAWNQSLKDDAESTIEERRAYDEAFGEYVERGTS